jgi:predicted Zn-dependent protease
VLGFGWFSGGQDAGAVPDRTVLVQVHQGETLWGVAAQMAPSVSTTAVVDRIRQLNGLDANSVLVPGQLLQVPSALTAAAEAKAGVVQR